MLRIYERCPLGLGVVFATPLALWGMMSVKYCLGFMMCLKRDNDEGRSFSTHLHVIGQINSWQGLNLLNLLIFFSLLMVIHNERFSYQNTNYP